MKIKRLIAWVLAVPLGLFIFIVLWAIFVPWHSPLDAALKYLPLGWWHFLQRNLSQIIFNWNLIATGIICSVLLVVAGDRLLRALFRQAQQSTRPDQPAQPWRWRWTICLYVAVWLLFAIAFGAAGVFRHTTWLMNYRQPWYEERMHSFLELRSLDGTIRLLQMDADDDLEKTRKAFLNERSYRNNQKLVSDEFNVIFYGDRSNKVAAYVIIPRNTQLLAQGRFGVSILGTNDLVRPVSELQRTIAQLDAAYPEKR